MGTQRPRLLLIEGHAGGAGDVSDALKAAFEIRVASIPDARRQLREGEADYVFASADSFIPLESKLEESRTSDILSALGGGVCLCDLGGVILWETERFGDYDDQTRERVAHACEQAARTFQSMAEAGRTPTLRRFNIVGSEEDGAERWFEVVVSPVRIGVMKPTTNSSSSGRSPRWCGT